MQLKYCKVMQLLCLALLCSAQLYSEVRPGKVFPQIMQLMKQTPE